jgi:FO synthase
MESSQDVSASELEWTVMVAVHLLAPLGIPVQTPPNLSRPSHLQRLLALGVSDFGGISPVTPDHVNPEAAWPEIEHLRGLTEASGHSLVPRLPVYPRYCTGRRSAPPVLGVWQDPALHAGIFRLMDGEGLARREETASSDAEGGGWSAGGLASPPCSKTDRDGRFLPGGAEYVKWKAWEDVPYTSKQV